MIDSPRYDSKLSISHPFIIIQMNKEIALGMLSTANNGEDILNILDVIVADESMTHAGAVVDFEGNPTEFWCD